MENVVFILTFLFILSGIGSLDSSVSMLERQCYLDLLKSLFIIKMVLQGCVLFVLFIKKTSIFFEFVLKYVCRYLLEPPP